MSHNHVFQNIQNPNQPEHIQTQPAANSAHHFYQNDQLATEVTAQGNRHVLWANETALVQHGQANNAKMLRVDLANSILGIANAPMAYAPYGHRLDSEMKALLGFNGQRRDPVTKGYSLGNGRRLYSTKTRRFCSPDILSPFDEGSLNAYAYCEGDPINRHDPTGQFFQNLFRSLRSSALKNTGRAINFATSGISRNPVPADKSLRQLYNKAQTFATFQKSAKPATILPQGSVVPALQRNSSRSLTASLAQAIHPQTATPCRALSLQGSTPLKSVLLSTFRLSQAEATVLSRQAYICWAS
ncbi:RHS repeat-associated core domain-containing protein [Pseudomonas sp. Teo4]|uniref:RHS repeat-associated core domain-containing protein n=1 Tax=Pseudomonas sp. Teo4 TaxID=3064528 RepID=UPI002ABC838E|nr:RHS repeat-associated core domain-containing protein [Pseudomonas sp. Teo4]MDZ3994946.1 hypothetical protein [Pseudomonas sp. Teo4]